MLEASLKQQKADNDNRMPDLRSTLDAVELLQATRERAANKDDDDDDDDNDDGDNNKAGQLKVQYELSETLYAKAVLDAPESVMLWLGADTMVEYPLDEAHALLTKQVERVKETTKQLADDIDYVKDNINTTRVNLARCHNWGVEQRRKQQQGK